MSKIGWLGTVSGDASVAGNWQGGVVPVGGDEVFVEANPSGTDVSISSGLTAFSALTLLSLNISQTFTANVGTTAAYLVANATTVNIGYNYGTATTVSGSPLIRINLGSVQSTVNVFGSSSSSSLVNAGPITLLGTHASNALNISSGTVTVAIDPTEVSTFATINNAGTLFLGSGLTLTAINNSDGAILIRDAVTTLTQSGGTVTTAGTGTITTANVYGGTFIATSTGTITTLNVQSATADFSQDPRAKTVTTANIYSGASLNVNNGVKSSITFTNPIVIKASSGQYALTVWPNTNLALS